MRLKIALALNSYQHCYLQARVAGKDTNTSPYCRFRPAMASSGSGIHTATCNTREMQRGGVKGKV